MPLITATSPAAWEEAMWSAFVPCALSRADTDFRAELQSVGLGAGFVLSRLKAGPFAVARPPRLIHDHPREDLIIVVQQRGAGSLRQSGRVEDVSGRLVIADTTAPYVWDYATALDQFVLQFPICHLPPLLHDVTRLRGGSFPVATPSARVLVAALRALVEVESESLDGAEELTYTLGDLLGSVVLRSSDRPAAPTEAKELALAMVRRTVAERFAEPDLTSTTLARLHNMSPRSLSALFAATGTSPAAYIRERRLEAARRRLLDPRWAGVTVAAVAARCGFLDTGTFTRAYRRAYGVLPSEDRAAAALAGAVSRS